MYEVIWNTESNCHLLRPVKENSTIKPLFIGTRNECAAWIVRNTQFR
jgi:hypothetical protein